MAFTYNRKAFLQINPTSFSSTHVCTCVKDASPCSTSVFCFSHILKSSVIYYWTDALQHGIYLLNGRHAPVNDAKQFPKASHLSGLQFLQDVCCHCPGFTGVQQYWDIKPGQYFWTVLLDSTSGLEPWSWRLCPDTSNCPLINLIQFFTNEKPIAFNFAILFCLFHDLVACLYFFLLSLHFCS